MVENRCRRLADRIGRRGASLLIFGAMYVLGGIPLLVKPARTHLHVYELRIWAVAFVIAGIIAWANAFKRKRDKAGFVALMMIGWVWVAYCALSSILYIFYPHIFPLLVGLTFQNALLMILILVTSGLTESFEPVDLTRTLKTLTPTRPNDLKNPTRPSDPKGQDHAD
jgi:hypothetical protein